MPEPLLRNLIVVLGDQLAPDSPALEHMDPRQDLVWMAEVPAESLHPLSHRVRSAFFLSSMRHFAKEQHAQGRKVRYLRLGTHPYPSLAAALEAELATLRPQRVIALEAGEWRLEQDLGSVCQRAGIPLEWREDSYFLCSKREFSQWARGKKKYLMESFYRWMRNRHRILLEGPNQPVGGRWNFDTDNRRGPDAQLLAALRPPQSFSPDQLTQEVLADLAQELPQLPGNTGHFDWPVTPAEARAALADFIANRLPLFGRYQDAMLPGEPWLFHARISAALNVKLLHPQEVIQQALQAYQLGQAPLAAVEGFIRQILGWREYVRGIYWQEMPGLVDSNALQAQQSLPPLYWTGQTQMRCLQETVGQVLRFGYAHHIQRLMVTGLFALLYGVRPQEVHHWYLGLFVDAVEWVEAPNTLGMSQYADGGKLASKPYVASGRYLERMSTYCQDCPFQPGLRSGSTACPFTVLYWDFLARHAEHFAHHPRVALQWKNLERLQESERLSIAQQAQKIRAALAEGKL